MPASSAPRWGPAWRFAASKGRSPSCTARRAAPTYIRRYMISHFREPMDIASSNFSEATAIFGGRENLREGLGERHPPVRTRADRHRHHLPGRDDRRRRGLPSPARFAPKPIAPLPELVHVSTPSYAGTHVEGFHAAVRAMVETLAEAGPAARGHQPAARHGLAGRSALPEGDVAAISAWSRSCCPTTRDTLDGPTWSEYQRIPPGGTPIDGDPPHGRRPGDHRVRLDAATRPNTAGRAARRAIRRAALRIAAADRRRRRPTGFFDVLERLTGRPMPAAHRGRARPADRLLRRRPQVRVRQAGRGLRRAGPGRRAGLVAGGDRHGAGALRLGRQEPAACASRSRRSSRTSREDMTVIEGADFAEIEDPCRRPCSPTW